MKSHKSSAKGISCETENPQIAVIVPAYGVAHLVAEALDSLCLQTFINWEAWIIDDGAPDDVAAAVAPFLKDPRIHFIASDNAGVSAARNRAIAETTAPLIALLDGDDLFKPDYLQQMVTAMQMDPNAMIVTCNARIFGAIARETLIFPESHNVPAVSTAYDVIAGTSNIYIGSTFRKIGWQNVGGFDSNMTHSEDLDFWIRLLLLKGAHVRFIDAVLGDYRIRGNSASTNSLALIRGKITLYQKIIALRPNSPEAQLSAQKLLKERKTESLELAIADTIAGKLPSGLNALRLQRNQLTGAVWIVCFALWRLFPRLAPPMLAWRRTRHIHSIAAGDHQGKSVR